MRLIITRPREDAGPLAAELAQRGHEAILRPVLEIVPRKGVVVPALRYQAICVTSANGLRALAQPVDKTLPLLAVGPQSAQAAQALGFANVTAEGGDVQGLARYIIANLKPAQGPLLYLSGAETSGDLAGALGAAGFAVTRLVTYDAVPQRFSDIPLADGVLLYSPRSAKLWIAEAERLRYDVSRLMHFCLSAQVAALLPAAAPRKIAASPNEAAMLRLIDLHAKSE